MWGTVLALRLTGASLEWVTPQSLDALDRRDLTGVAVDVLGKREVKLRPEGSDCIHHWSPMGGSDSRPGTIGTIRTWC